MTFPRRGEFVALLAMLSATTAFAIDAMLPALPQIGAQLSPADPERAQLVLTAFVLGLGIGILFAGPLGDALGRRRVMLGGLAIYTLGAVAAWLSDTLVTLLLARMLMGLGAAAPRVMVTAILRDRLSGAEMARILSLVMVVFMLVPAIAPAIGAGIIALADWRAVFLAFAVFGVVAAFWFGLRLPETLAPDRRRTLNIRTLRAGVVEVLSHPVVRLSLMVQMLIFGMLFALLSSAQAVFDQAYGRGAEFPAWFVLIAAASAVGNFANGRFVMRLGPLRIVRIALTAQGMAAAVMLTAIALPLPQDVEFAVWMVWACTVFIQGALSAGNLNAIALQPLGHLAGLAASVMAAGATAGSVLIAVPLGLAFNGTAVPLATGILGVTVLAVVISGRLAALRQGATES